MEAQDYTDHGVCAASFAEPPRSEIESWGWTTKRPWSHFQIELTPFEVSLEMILVKIQLLRNELAYEIDKKTLAIQLHGTLLTRAPIHFVCYLLCRGQCWSDFDCTNISESRESCEGCDRGAENPHEGSLQILRDAAGGSAGKFVIFVLSRFSLIVRFARSL